MSEKIQCSDCKHKLPKEICGCSESPNYNQRIEPTNSCEYFSENPAMGHFTMGLVKCYEKATPEGVREIETAIKLGLSRDDEMKARFFLGGYYSEFVKKGVPVEEMVTSYEFLESTNQMEKAVLMDFEGGYGYFLDPLNRLRLGQLDFAYSLVFHTIHEKESVDAAIAYAHQKLRLFDYLPSTPMLNLLFVLGCLYHENGKTESARESFRKILESEAVNYVDENGLEAELRRKAEHNLRLAESEGVKQSKCYIVTAVYNENAPEVEIFRRFRDEVLLSMILGKIMVSLYYLISPHIYKSIGRSENVKRFIKIIFLKPTLSLIKLTNHRTRKVGTLREISK